MNKPTLSVDFDGTLHDYSSGWQGVANIPDPPTKGAMRWLLRATKHWEVVIYSTRSKFQEGRDAMWEWTARHARAELEPEEATHLLTSIQFAADKPWAYLSIDDRAITFQGDWSKLDPKELLNFRPWNKDRGWTPPQV